MISFLCIALSLPSFFLIIFAFFFSLTCNEFFFFPHKQNKIVHYLSEVMIGQNIQTHAFRFYSININITTTTNNNNNNNNDNFYQSLVFLSLSFLPEADDKCVMYSVIAISLPLSLSLIVFVFFFSLTCNLFFSLLFFLSSQLG